MFSHFVAQLQTQNSGNRETWNEVEIEHSSNVNDVDGRVSKWLQLLNKKLEQVARYVVQHVISHTYDYILMYTYFDM